MRREEKKRIIDELAGVFSRSVSVLVVEYRGLDVRSMQSVRRDIKRADAELRVVKNKFLLKACAGTDVEKIKDLFQGPTAIAICGTEFPQAAKVFVKAREEFEKLVLKGGLVDGRVCGAEEIERISKLPSRPELIAMFASALASPLSKFAGLLHQLRVRPLYVLSALKEAKKGLEAAQARQPESPVSPDEKPVVAAETKKETGKSADKKEEKGDA